jgi:putative ABC transport system permease protein
MTTGVPLFTMGDLDAIRRQAHDVAPVTAAGSRVERVAYSGRNRASAVGGVMPEYFEIRSWDVSSGRLYNQEDERQGGSVCHRADDRRRPLPGPEPAGKGHARAGQDLPGHRSPGVEGRCGRHRPGCVVFLPYSTFTRRLVGSDRAPTILASAVSTDQIDETKEQMTQILRRRRHIAVGDDDNFSVRDRATSRPCSSR